MNADGAARRLGPMAWMLAGMLAVGTAHAQGMIPGYPPNINAFDPREVGMLPRYCIYTQEFRERVPGGNNQAIIDGWYARLGTAFHALHHYCYGLMKTNRAVLLARDDRIRRYYLSDAVMEFDYVIERANDDFELLPEIVTRKGQNLVLLGKGPIAVYEFERAIDLKKDYWPPYAYMSDYYKETGDTQKARQWLEKGLAEVPDAKGLRRRLAELGTKR
jgi:tetratricopeptide (TPR) repeat protein